MEQEFRLKNIFSQEDIQLLYHACLSYGDGLVEINEKVHGCSDVTKQLDVRAKEAYNMAARLALRMEEDNT